MAVNCRAASKRVPGMHVHGVNPADGHALSRVSGQDEMERNFDQDAAKPIPVRNEDGLPTALRHAIFHWNFYRVVVFLLLVTSFVGEKFPS